MFEITITRQELFELWHGLFLLANLKGFKLAYAVARTKAKLKPEIEALDEALKPDNAFQEYEKKRLNLCRKYARKDEFGEPIVQGNQFVFENREEFEAQMIPLDDEYVNAIEVRKAQLEDYQKSLREPITVEVHQVSPDDLPQDLTVKEMEVLYLFIKDSDVV